MAAGSERGKEQPCNSAGLAWGLLLRPVQTTLWKEDLSQTICLVIGAVLAPRLILKVTTSSIAGKTRCREQVRWQPADSRCCLEHDQERLVLVVSDVGAPLLCMAKVKPLASAR